MDDVWTVILYLSFLFPISLLESVELFGYNLRHNALLTCIVLILLSISRDILVMRNRAMLKGSAALVVCRGSSQDMAGARITAIQLVQYYSATCSLIIITFFLSSFVWHAGELG